jgi:hypothetical protein
MKIDRVQVADGVPRDCEVADLLIVGPEGSFITDRSFRSDCFSEDPNSTSVLINAVAV